MTTIAAHEATTGAEVEAWHDEATVEYRAAYEAYSADVAARRAAGDPVGNDPALREAYEEKRDQLSAGTQYWRQVGEQVGTRTGVAIQDHVLPANDEDGA